MSNANPANQKKGFLSIALLLRSPRQISAESVQSACGAAFRGAPEPARIVPLKNGFGFGIAIGPLRLGLLSIGKPYFSDVGKTAEGIRNFPARVAVQEHTAWLSVDLVGDAGGFDDQKVYSIIGRVIAEFLGDDVLGLAHLPSGPVVAYDFSFIPKFRNGRAEEVFRLGAPDRVVTVDSNREELLRATAEARQRWPEFVKAFEARQPRQGFGVKAKFSDGGKPEHMWIEVSSIDGQAIHGRLANTPGIVKSLKLGDAVMIAFEEIEDWIYTNGKENVGGFQAKVIKGNQN